ncbi:HicB family protein [Thiocystis minor]|uniref:type II toxin-antitoxin system HicB family antitoxin n=1 Tax=Thiocystis minor TaxID=61597 RepID=UPI001914886D|nr:type II toxin-antitoxin system HicB family antitoxin [Thiocystis minor]MBK5963158.1 HicB family protein [Thiocystis minor]
MQHPFTLEYWQDDGWYVGRLKEIPGVFSQGENLEELETNIEDAYRMLLESDSDGSRPSAMTKQILLDVA